MYIGKLNSLARSIMFLRFGLRFGRVYLYLSQNLLVLVDLTTDALSDSPNYNVEHDLASMGNKGDGPVVFALTCITFPGKW